MKQSLFVFVIQHDTAICWILCVDCNRHKPAPAK